ncbi:11475_t:CDS:2, partial [Ambispora gerdemannii]
NKNKEEALLQTYDRTFSQLGVSLIAKTYGYANMYKNLDHEDVMHVENKLGKLEEQASKVVRDIMKASQVESQIVLLRRDLEDLQKFMQQHKLQIAQEVWLQNIREILETPHEDIKADLRIFLADRTISTYVATPKYVPINEYGRSTDRNMFTAFDSYLNSIGLERRDDDTFTFPFVKVTSATVHLVNSFLLNEAKPDLVLTFLSRSPGLLDFEKEIIHGVKQNSRGKLESPEKHLI